MSDVVIRCPNCGTTQATLGECEACHEAEARYFCPNHAPGRWIDGPTCPSCGARHTGRTRVEAPPPRVTQPRVSRTGPPAPPPTYDAPGRIEELPIEERAPARWPPREAWPPEPSLPRVRVVGLPSLFGCVGRMAMIVVVLFVLGFLSIFGYCGSITVGYAPESPAIAEHAPAAPAP